ncbi:MAG: chromosomal replication initiator protein DnaA [Firmicutes bacterium]|nr:chromosomal replication initiator protein DnaA [Bacillota bacterium]
MQPEKVNRPTEPSLSSYWSEALVLLQNAFTDVVYDTWIKTLEPLYREGNLIILKTQEDFFKTTIMQRYLYDITNGLKAVMEQDIEVKVVSPEDMDPKKRKAKKDHIDLLNQSNLKSKYVFETFVRGKSNELAYAAAVAVAEAPGRTTYNPLFLYGGVGLGKTHLMQSIGNYVLEQDPEKRVLYASTETFTNELITSIKERKNQEFRNKYRDIDVLLIDDIQFLSDKEGTQEEFFHTFNTLYDANKQIVISSDQPPKEIKTLEDRLRSRFGCGLIVDITLPDFETRAAILEKKAEMDHMDVSNEVIQFIAKNIVSNIRELEGALNKVAAYAKLTKQVVNTDLAEQALRDMIYETEKREVSVEYIQEVVSNHYNITAEELRSKKRTQKLTYPRQVAMYLSRKLVDKSLPQLGQLFGGRDHTTIIHGCDKISDESERDITLRLTLIELEKKIKGEA